MTTVSIVIPSFNRASLMARAVRHALAQTHACEVLVCDHGSTDDTPKVAANFGDRIRYVRRETDNGPIACWRDGIEQARGEFVHINYDDDWVEPEFIAECVSRFGPHVGFVYTGFRVHDTASGTVAESAPHPKGLREMRHIERYLLRLPLTMSPGCAVFRRADALANLLPEVPGARGIYGKNAGVGEDLLLFLLTARSYPYYVHVPRPLANFMAHPGSITTDAMQSRKYQELVMAYSRAKSYYYGLERERDPRSGLGDWLDRIEWSLSAGIVNSTMRRVARRLARSASA